MRSSRLRKWAREGALTELDLPETIRHWEYTPSIQIMKQIMSDRMYPLTLEGLDKAMRELNR